MNVESIVNDVKARADVVVSRSQGVVEVSVETVKAANSIVVESVQTLVKTNVDAGKQLVQLSQASFEKAKADGVKVVAKNPLAYLPEGKDAVVGAYNDSLAAVTKASGELAKTFKEGFGNITATAKGEKVEQKVEAAAAEVKKTVRKAASRAKKAAEQVVDAA
ncbi:hypothetical protein [Sinimarinibacterium sp. NLF-5-8]|uniref:hypothetical protein n=1 Tax=Sinimarinibacterium sp. NLF-5-8 TaxID=2698684 RepID=UPI00137BBED1|nr:hypothetical protein [Sinimarinibacterium sp. NLF-5-8]QHS10104.1 hypothetical protein GT972_08090 [Sinimarinibacterium sp. NLF-5-8]